MSAVSMAKGCVSVLLPGDRMKKLGIIKAVGSILVFSSDLFLPYSAAGDKIFLFFFKIFFLI